MERNCDLCGDSPVPGAIAAPAGSLSGRMIVQACDTCQLFPGDLDAAWAVAQALGGRAYFRPANTPLHPRHLEEPGPYPDAWLIDTGTDPWVQVPRRR